MLTFGAWKLAARACFLAVCACAAWTQNSAPSGGNPAKNGIGCLGRIEPEDGVIRVTAPYVDGAPAIIERLLARENASVQKGQVLAVLHGEEAVEASIREATARVEAARKRVELAKERPKQADIEARQAAASRFELEYRHAQEELTRYENLRKTEDVTVAELEERRTKALAAERAWDEARQSLRGFQEISAPAVEVAEAELAVAVAAEGRALAARANTKVKAPEAGTVLRIHAHAGEQVGPEGLLELANTDRMYVIAEVYESDIRRVHVGSSAVISGQMLAAPLTGKVERVGGMIARSQVLPTDPASFSDTRIVPVHIRLADGTAAARLIHGKVSVVIEP
jgi:HlyD family secretion protein